MTGRGSPRRLIVSRGGRAVKDSGQADSLGTTTLKAAMIEIPLDAKVLTALERNPYLARRSLRFETMEGRVTLRGVVRSYFQKQMAQEALRHVDGVKEIANELEVATQVPATWPPQRGRRGQPPITASVRSL
jgi:osmotically-inducible protein OsmY